MFRKGIMFYECKDFLVTNSVYMRPDIVIDTKTHFEISIKKGPRKINIALISHARHPMEVDITDSFFMFREPRKSFKNKEKFQTYMLDMLKKISFVMT